MNSGAAQPTKRWSQSLDSWVLTNIILAGHPKYLCNALNHEKIDEMTNLLASTCFRVGSDLAENDLDEIEKRVEESFKSSLSITEYEDSKAARVLTAIAFLTTLGGTFFIYSHSLASDGYFHCLTSMLTMVFITSILLGSLWILWAITPRFNLPRNQRIKSLTFFRMIASMEPRQWIESFSDKTAAELREEAIRSRIMEAYLISGKAHLKVTIVRRGIWILNIGLVTLLVQGVSTSFYKLFL
jgi:hypothetical protein